MNSKELEKYLRSRVLLEVKANELRSRLDEEQIGNIALYLASDDKLLTEGFFGTIGALLGGGLSETKRFLAKRVVSFLGVPTNHPLSQPLTDFITRMPTRDIYGLYRGEPRLRRKLVHVLTNETISAFKREMPHIMGLKGGSLGGPITDAMIRVVDKPEFKKAVKQSFEEALIRLPASDTGDMDSIKRDLEDLKKSVADIAQSLKGRTKSDPTDADTDNDGLPDGEEDVIGTDPRRADTDNDGLPDGAEVGKDPALKDKVRQAAVEEPARPEGTPLKTPVADVPPGPAAEDPGEVPPGEDPAIDPAIDPEAAAAAVDAEPEVPGATKYSYRESESKIKKFMTDIKKKLVSKDTEYGNLFVDRTLGRKIPPSRIYQPARGDGSWIAKLVQMPIPDGVRFNNNALRNSSALANPEIMGPFSAAATDIEKLEVLKQIFPAEQLDQIQKALRVTANQAPTPEGVSAAEDKPAVEPDERDPSINTTATVDAEGEVSVEAGAPEPEITDKDKRDLEVLRIRFNRVGEESFLSNKRLFKSLTELAQMAKLDTIVKDLNKISGREKAGELERGRAKGRINVSDILNQISEAFGVGVPEGTPEAPIPEPEAVPEVPPEAEAAPEAAPEAASEPEVSQVGSKLQQAHDDVMKQKTVIDMGDISQIASKYSLQFASLEENGDTWSVYPSENPEAAVVYDNNNAFFIPLGKSKKAYQKLFSGVKRIYPRIEYKEYPMGKLENNVFVLEKQGKWLDPVDSENVKYPESTPATEEIPLEPEAEAAPEVGPPSDTGDWRDKLTKEEDPAAIMKKYIRLVAAYEHASDKKEEDALAREIDAYEDKYPGIDEEPSAEAEPAAVAAVDDDSDLDLGSREEQEAAIDDMFPPKPEVALKHAVDVQVASDEADAEEEEADTAADAAEMAAAEVTAKGGDPEDIAAAEAEAKREREKADKAGRVAVRRTRRAGTARANVASGRGRVKEADANWPPKIKAARDKVMIAVKEVDKEIGLWKYRNGLNAYINGRLEAFAVDEAEAKREAEGDEKKIKAAEKEAARNIKGLIKTMIGDTRGTPGIIDKIKETNSTAYVKSFFSGVGQEKQEAEGSTGRKFKEVNVELYEDKTVVLTHREREGKIKTVKAPLEEGLKRFRREGVNIVELGPISTDDLKKVYWKSATPSTKEAITNAIKNMLRQKKNELSEQLRDEEGSEKNEAVQKQLEEIEHFDIESLRIRGDIIDSLGQHVAGVIDNRKTEEVSFDKEDPEMRQIEKIFNGFKTNAFRNGKIHIDKLRAYSKQFNKRGLIEKRQVFINMLKHFVDKGILDKNYKTLDMEDFEYDDDGQRTMAHMMDVFVALGMTPPLATGKESEEDLEAEVARQMAAHQAGEGKEEETIEEVFKVSRDLLRKLLA